MADQRRSAAGADVEDPVSHDEQTPLLSRRRDSQSKVPGLFGSVERPKLLLRGLVGLLFVLFFILLGLLFLLPAPQAPPPVLDSRGRLNPAHLAQGSRGGVAAENVECSKIGVALLERGGSAADAAVGAALCIGVLNMFSSGIGGGGFAMIRAPESNGSAEADHIVIDFRETAPGAAYPEMFHSNPEAAKYGGLSVAVPGELRGLEEIWSRWGRLRWSEVVEPSVELAKEAKVGRELVRKMKGYGSFIAEKPEWEDIFMDASTGRFLEVGDTIRRPAYAKTLQAIAEQGSEAFYSGPIAEAIINRVQATGGIMTLEDLAAYRIETRAALAGQWTGGRKAWTSPAPTSGPILLEMMNALRLLGYEKYADVEQHRRRNLGSHNDSYVEEEIALQSLWTHRLVEVMKHAYASRTRLGDPAFLNASWLLEIAKISSLPKAKEILTKIDDDRTFPIEYYDPLFDVPEDHGTTHVSVVDDDGMSVGITTTVNLIFGSRVMDPVTGIIFNDEMDDSSTPGVPNAFGLRPSPFNYPEPHKRPLSSITPLIIESPTGHFELLLGGAGGSMIPTAILQTLLNVDRGFNLSEAIEETRIHHQLLPSQAIIETTILDPSNPIKLGVEEELKKRGHQLFPLEINSAIAVCDGVQVLRGHGGEKEVRAASDSRKNGWAVAY